MDGKDNRSREKRSKMKHYNQRKAQRAAGPAAHNTSSSSQMEPQPVRSIVDVADSSDDRFAARRGGWKASDGMPTPQQSRHFSVDDTELDELNDLENAHMHAGDFHLMSQLAASGGGHFQFASEKHWDAAAEGEQLLDNTEASEYFTLNLKLLNVGLQTIPFYKRMDYAASMFTRDQLQSMEKAAEVAEKNYQNVLKEHEMNPRIKINSGSNRKNGGSAKTNNSNKHSAVAGSSDAADALQQQELDELLNMTTTQVGKVSLDVARVETISPVATVAAATEDAANKDDIQQWLDNVLEE